MTCSQGPRWLDHNICGSTTSNCTVYDEDVTCPDCLDIMRRVNAPSLPDRRYWQWKSSLKDFWNALFNG